MAIADPGDQCNFARAPDNRDQQRVAKDFVVSDERGNL